MSSDLTNDWVQLRALILDKLERGEQERAELREGQEAIKLQLNTLKVKMGTYGAIAGAIAGAIPTVISIIQGIM